MRAKHSLERTSLEHGAWPPMRSGLACALRANHHAGSGPLSWKVRRHKMTTIVQFGSDSEHVRFSVPSEFTERGWSQVTVEIAVTSFRGVVSPWIDRDDMRALSDQLHGLYESLSGEARFNQLDGQLSLTLTAKAGGHIVLSGWAWSQPEHQNKLEFELKLDQSFLEQPLSALRELLRGVENGA